MAGLATAAPERAFAQEDPDTQSGEDPAPWTISVSVGSTVFSGGSDQPFVEISIGRDFGESWLELSGAYVESGGDPVSAGFVPATTRQASLSGGTSFAAVSLGVYAAFGERRFDSLEFARRDGRSVTVDSDGSSFGIGGSATYDIPVGTSSFLSPSVSLDYAEADVARAVNVPGAGLFTIKEQEDGITVTGSLSYQHLFGEEYAHNLGAYAGVVHSSNNAVYNPGNSPQALINLFALRDAPGREDGWVEIGGTGSFGLGSNLRLNLVAIRTLGFAGPEATSLSAGVAISF